MKNNPANGKAWSDRDDLVIEIASPEVAAEKLWRSVETVKKRGQELGIHDGFRRPLPRNQKPENGSNHGGLQGKSVRPAPRCRLAGLFRAGIESWDG